MKGRYRCICEDCGIKVWTDRRDRGTASGSSVPVVVGAIWHLRRLRLPERGSFSPAKPMRPRLRTA
jgi:hypothetical protein